MINDKLWLEWLSSVDPFSYGYLSCSQEDHELKLANALYSYWASMTPIIDPTDQLVGRIHRHGVGGFSFGSGIFCDTREAENLKQKHPEWSNYLDSLVSFWMKLTPGSRIHLPEDERYLGGQNVYWAGWGGHAVLGFEELLASGIDRIREKIEYYNSRENDPKRVIYRNALLIVCDGIEAFAQNYSYTALKMAEEEKDSLRRVELMAISRICSHVPKNGARSFPEALQSFWFIHLLEGTDSPGRFDQYMFPYYHRDINSETLTREEAQNWVDHLWKRFNDTRSWNVCIGGLRRDGVDGTNDLTFMALEATKRIRKVAPNLSLRLHKNSPERLWAKAVEVIGTGVGMPALYNDDVLVPALMRYGISEEDARDYAMNGCSQIDIQGKSHIGLEDGEMNLLKCLELALHDGLEPLSNRQVGPHTGDPECFTSFDHVWQAYTGQVEALTRRMISAANACQKAHSETSPNLFRSLFVEGCIEKGKDFKSGGPIYNHGQILTQGIANTADSLAAIKKLVFDENRISMAELLDAMRDDFPEESLRQLLIHESPKFGNDDDYVDSLAAKVIDHFYRHLNTYHTWRGGIYGGGSIVFTRAVSFGSKVGATPDGRKAYTPLSDSVGPSQGRDMHGPTAVFSSCAKIPQVLAQSAYVLNVKFTHKVLDKKKLVSLFRTYFQKGGQQIQVNIVDKETLIDAREHPEKYEGLVVRVGGFSGYFTRLSPAHQEDIIARTEHSV